MTRTCKECLDHIPPASKSTIVFHKKKFCSFDCMTKWGLKQVEIKKQTERQKAIEWQREFKENTKTKSQAKEYIKTTSQRKQEAQKAFNAFIRYRDRSQDCISCDRPISEIQGRDGWKPGGAWDCGHFLTVGAHEELRFEELNAHRQCKSCNGGSGNFTAKEATVSKRYREKLIERIGLDKVEWLEGPHEPKRYRDEDFDRIKKEYKQKLKQLKEIEQ